MKFEKSVETSRKDLFDFQILHASVILSYNKNLQAGIEIDLNRAVNGVPIGEIIRTYKEKVQCLAHLTKESRHSLHHRVNKQ
ncbi:hypothetical protein SAMN05444008_105149 [Cnuella takakiae]|uniref:Uncharacterized protein n=1 Tax=Cnuella takakiae TaxID=1302690 RepID=A0A1M4ZAD8_9BACT|nr:hypothetical protein [Cnuella takakiae]OLY94276.1 hypothetical protein BUE76_22100 [Cnuella takakiae]SHF14974.1 hypothetical protein SAMN05444008_105149 [Cnuella takakiae]